MTMLERVARAMLQAGLAGAGPLYADDDAKWAEHLAWYREGMARGDLSATASTIGLAHTIARAALTAMREPTDTMIDALADEVHCPMNVAKHGIRVAIDAALAEGIK